MKRDDKTRQSLQSPSTPIALEVVLESGAAEEDITPIELWRRSCWRARPWTVMVLRKALQTKFCGHEKEVTVEHFYLRSCDRR